MAVGALIGPALAGLLVGLSGVRVPLLLDAACYLAIGAASGLIRTRRGTTAAKDAAQAIGWRLRADRLLLALAVMIGLMLLAVNTTQVVVVFFIRGTLHGSAITYGVTEATWTAGLLVGGWVAAG